MKSSVSVRIVCCYPLDHLTLLSSDPYQTFTRRLAKEPEILGRQRNFYLLNSRLFYKTFQFGKTVPLLDACLIYISLAEKPGKLLDLLDVSETC